MWEIKIANCSPQSEVGVVMHHAGRITHCKRHINSSEPKKAEYYGCAGLVDLATHKQDALTSKNALEMSVID